METPLISIITPCYNTAHLVYRLLDSVLEQTYPNIEMFLIDDGSSDNLKEIFERYKPRFIQRGYTLKYVRQDNSGQSAALNNGLKLIKGEYLVWPDSDDFYAAKEALEILYNTFKENNDNIGIVRSDINYVNEENLDIIYKSNLITYEDLFIDCLLQKNNFSFVTGTYMVKVADIDRLIPGREIYTEKSAGQNWQILLPFLYKNRCITIKKHLHNILVRKNSHSRTHRPSIEKAINMIDVYERTIINTLDRMPTLENECKEHYITLVKNKYHIERLQIALSFKDKDKIKEYFNIVKQNKIELPLKLKLRLRFGIIYTAYSKLRKLF